MKKMPETRSGIYECTAAYREALGEAIDIRMFIEALGAKKYEEIGCVAQLVRAPACHAGGRRFEPDRTRHQESAGHPHRRRCGVNAGQG